MDDELKHCPFCGGEAHITIWNLPFRSSKEASVVCSACGAMTWPYISSEGLAVESWNRRADDK